MTTTIALFEYQIQAGLTRSHGDTERTPALSFSVSLCLRVNRFSYK